MNFCAFARGRAHPDSAIILGRADLPVSPIFPSRALSAGRKKPGSRAGELRRFKTAAAIAGHNARNVLDLFRISSLGFRVSAPAGYLPGAGWSG